MEHADSQFAELTECDLSASFSRFDSLPAGQPVLPASGPLDNRDTYLRRQGETAHAPSPDASVAPTPVEDMDEGARLNSAFKTVSLLGQVLRGSLGSTTAAEKLALTTRSYALALRVLAWLLGDIQAGFGDLIECVSLSLAGDREVTPDDRQQANKLMFALLQMVSFVTIRHVADSLGHEMLAPTMREALHSSNRHLCETQSL